PLETVERRQRWNYTNVPTSPRRVVREIRVQLEKGEDINGVDKGSKTSAVEQALAQQPGKNIKSDDQTVLVDTTSAAPSSGLVTSTTTSTATP
ncbi:unnamed protein product, partial [Amoebophrya sp. A120]